MNRLKQVVNEIRDDELDDQDYFYPRSRFFQDTVLECASDPDFSRVFSGFHRSVSLMNIPRFDTFRRYGYQVSYALRAFNRWEDGKKFYDDIYAQTNNFYDLQQAALYLNVKRRFKDAFVYINKARTQSRDQKFSIRNTYARILFSANYDLASSNDASLDHLFDSMKIIYNCYADDKRKVNHAILYAEQSLLLAKILKLDECREYLERSAKWLAEELKAQNMRRMKGLLRDVSRALGD